MPDEVRPPVAIRSLRPYTTEEAFLAEERDTLTRTAVTLIGAPSRPRGVVIRFELTLSDGTPLVRGEGRVLSFQPADEHGPSSLTLRFTRLDAKSKALVDRAAALRESVRPPESEVLTADTDPPAAPEGASSSTTPPPNTTEPPPPSEEPPPLAISSGNLPLVDAEEVGSSDTLAPSPPSVPPVTDPFKRDSLLDRLRTRAKTLSPSEVAAILAAPKPRSGAS